MKIGIIGAGHIGATAAKLFTQAGHDVAISNSRGPASLSELIGKLGPRSRAMTVEDAAKFGDIVVLAVPWRTPEALPRAETVAGKIVIDAMNPYTAQGGIMDLGDRSSSERVAARLPGARLVKAFNTIYWEHLASEGRPDLPLPERRAVFVAGDDPEAKRVVQKLIEQVGFAAIDMGSLREGGPRLEPGAAVYNCDLTAMQAQATLVRRQ